MDEKTFFVDPRSKRQEFWDQVNIAFYEIITTPGEIRVHCPDPEYAKKFKKALDAKLKELDDMYSEVSKIKEALDKDG